MGLLGNILGSVADGIRDSSDSKYIEELKPKMMDSAIAKDFEAWFKLQLEAKPFLYSQYNYYDDCERLVIVDNDCVLVCFEIAKADVSDEVVCNFATTLGYKPLAANGLTYSNGKVASERVLIKTFSEVSREIIKKVLTGIAGSFHFGYIEYDDGTDKNGSYWDQVTQRSLDSGRLHQIAGFTYKVPKQEQKSAF